MLVFYIAKPTPPVHRAFSKVRDWINTEDRYDQLVRYCKCFDQKLLDWAIRGQGQLGSKWCLPETELGGPFDNVSSNLSWAYIPYARFPHFNFAGADLNNIVGAHAWSGMGPPPVQMQWAKDNGFWKGPATSDDGKISIDTGGRSGYSLSAHACSCDDFTTHRTQASFDGYLDMDS